MKICGDGSRPLFLSLLFLLTAAGCGREEAFNAEVQASQRSADLFGTSGSTELKSAMGNPARIFDISTQSLSGRFWIGTVRARDLPSTREVIPAPIKALLDTIAAAEGTSKADGTCGIHAGYTAIFSCKKLLPNFDRHPDTVSVSRRSASAAAGRYQFMPGTWTGKIPSLGKSVQSVVKRGNDVSTKQSQGPVDFSIANFGPLAQDMGASLLIKYKVRNGDLAWNTIQSLIPQSDGKFRNEDFLAFRGALDILAPEWASLPTRYNTSYYNQPVKRAIDLWQIFKEAYGIYAAEDQALPLAETESSGGAALALKL